MGWCSATEIFDTVAEVVLDNDSIPVKKQEEVIERLYSILRVHDWDCQWDSGYADHPIVKKLLDEELA
jgi:hypothetical protein